jgi:hypothetical protein
LLVAGGCEVGFETEGFIYIIFKGLGLSSPGFACDSAVKRLIDVILETYFPTTKECALTF